MSTGFNQAVSNVSAGINTAVKVATTPIVDVPILGKLSPLDIGITAVGVALPVVGAGLAFAKLGSDLATQHPASTPVVNSVEGTTF